MRYGYTISYESDTQPVVTVRGDFDAKDRSSAIRQGAKRAVKQWPKGRSFRSWVICVERLDNQPEVAAAAQIAQKDPQNTGLPGRRFRDPDAPGPDLDGPEAA
jgi:hypothetical protein